MSVTAQDKKYTEKLPWQQVLSLSSANFSQAVMLTTPFTIGVFMVRDFLAAKQGGSVEAVDEQLVGQLTGLLAGIFSFSSFLTAYAWGCASNYIGRKPVIAIGNFVSFVSILWFGLSGSYGTALAARAFGGFLNGILGAWKCMIGESTAVLLQGKFFGYMSLAWGLGCITGPALGGALSRPCSRAPHLVLCGEHGLLKRRPYFLPCAVGSLTILAAFLLSVLLLEETLPAAMQAKGLGAVIRRRVRRRRRERRRLLKHSQQQGIRGDGEEADAESDASAETSAREGLEVQLSDALELDELKHKMSRRWRRRGRRRQQQQQSTPEASPAAASRCALGSNGDADGELDAEVSGGSRLERAALLPGAAEARSDALPRALDRAPTHHHHHRSSVHLKAPEHYGISLRRLVLGGGRAPARPGLPPDVESNASFSTVSEFSDSEASTDPWDDTDAEHGRGGRGGGAGAGESPDRTPSVTRLEGLLRLASRTYIDFNPFRRNGSLRGRREGSNPPQAAPERPPPRVSAEPTTASVALAVRCPPATAVGAQTGGGHGCVEGRPGGGVTTAASGTMHDGGERGCGRVRDGHGLGGDTWDGSHGCEDWDNDRGDTPREPGAGGGGGGGGNGAKDKRALDLVGADRLALHPADGESQQSRSGRGGCGSGGGGGCRDGAPRWESSTSRAGAGSSSGAPGRVADGAAAEVAATAPLPRGSSTRQLAESPGAAGVEGQVIQDPERTPLLQPTPTASPRARDGEPQEEEHCGQIHRVVERHPGDHDQGACAGCGSGDGGLGDGGGSGGGEDSSALEQRVSHPAQPGSLHGSAAELWGAWEGGAGGTGDQARDRGGRAGRAGAAAEMEGGPETASGAAAAVDDCDPAGGQSPRRLEKGEELGGGDAVVEVLRDVAGGGEERAQARPWYRCREVVLTILGYGAVALIFCALDEVFPIYASAPLVSGGLGMREEQLAPPLMFFGIILMPYSLYVYPPLQRHVGTLRLTMVGLAVAFLTCFMLPLVADVRPASFVGAQVLLYGTMVAKAFAQCSAFTGSIIAVNAAPAPEQLGAVNGVGQTLAALVRGVGPALGGVLWSVSLGLHSAGQQFLTFAMIAGVAAATCGLYAFVRLPGMR